MSTRPRRSSSSSSTSTSSSSTPSSSSSPPPPARHRSSSSSRSSHATSSQQPPSSGADSSDTGGGGGGGIIANTKAWYEQLLSLIIRPPRMDFYTDADLGARDFVVRGVAAHREDTVVTSVHGHRLLVSHWRGIGRDGYRRRRRAFPPPPARPTVVYLHGNSGCRLDALSVLDALLPASIDVVAFDFSGSGRSDGEYVTLGHRERDDLAAVLAHLRAADSDVGRVALWGRSMGAATAVLYTADGDASVASLVLDSCFSSLSDLCHELVGHFVSVSLPRLAVGVGLRVVASSLRARAAMDLYALSPADAASKCHSPAFATHGQNDDFVISE